ncbi:MAG: nuclear transport factor 2 family protein [Streptosporangiaceae bacterium]
MSTAMQATSAAFLRDFADRWLTAWNSHDTGTVLALLHPDVQWDETVFWPHPLHGREAVRAYVDAIWRAMPGYSVSEVQLFTATDDGRALVLFRQRGAAPSGLGTQQRSSGQGSSGQGFDVQGCDIFLGFRDGLLAHYTAAFEIVDMLRQLGALPPRGDRKGGAYLLSLLEPRENEPAEASASSEGAIP